MNQYDVIQEFLGCLQKDSASPDRMAAHFLKAIEALGFRYFACCSHVDPLHPPSDAVMLHNYPPGWVRTFSEGKLHRIDPVLQRAESTPLPFFWDTAFQAARLTRPQQRMLADAAGYGIAHGYTVPLPLSWLPGTLRASCSAIPDAPGIDPRNYIAVEVLATYLYFFTSRLRAPWLAPPPVELTERERECLVLVAQGKDDWAIARLLGLGVSTIHYHIEQLKRRLNVSNRPQAVAQGFISGQLTFGEVVRKAASDPPRSDDDASSSH